MAYSYCGSTKYGDDYYHPISYGVLRIGISFRGWWIYHGYVDQATSLFANDNLHDGPIFGTHDWPCCWRIHKSIYFMAMDILRFDHVGRDTGIYLN
jgi:hypothetical protein